MVTQKTKDKIVDAFMVLAAEESYAAIEFASLAKKAGVKMSQLRSAYDGKLAILQDFAARIDSEVLDKIDPDMSDEPARDRLFDALMHRFDALAPYKDALRNIYKAFERDPPLAAAWNQIAVTSQSWMLRGAGIEQHGLSGTLRAQALVFAYAKTFRTWLDDDDPGLAKTMAELDKTLRHGERWLGRASDVARLISPVARLCKRRAERPGFTPDAAAPMEQA